MTLLGYLSGDDGNFNLSNEAILSDINKLNHYLSFMLPVFNIQAVFLKMAIA
jgi:hypothetical protein